MSPYKLCCSSQSENSVGSYWEGKCFLVKFNAQTSFSKESASGLVFYIDAEVQDQELHTGAEPHCPNSIIGVKPHKKCDGGTKDAAGDR